MPVVSAGSSASRTQPTAFAGHDPNAVCEPCHQGIYERYRKTPMANASGSAVDGFLPGRFTHPASGVSYRIIQQDGRVYLTFERDRSQGDADPLLKGRRELRYFLGSGLRGRTYLFEQDGYWFEIPINWYGKKRIWDMAPNYQNAREAPLTMPVDPGCLRCHTSGAQPSLPEARNHYAGEPFLQGGINCTACHGDAQAHVASEGKTAMVSLQQLAPVRRDSICLSCHLEGEEAVVHQGKRLVDFRPGDDIFDYATFFVGQGQSSVRRGAAARATSQWEALLQSRCKQASGDKLTCTTCHDPHGSTVSMSANERVVFYRAKCLQCHDADEAQRQGMLGTGERKGFEATHHPENPDCASCHMPRATAEDIAHEQVTDHRIPRFPGERVDAMSVAGSLVAVSSGIGAAETTSDRDKGLAYALAARGDRAEEEQARQLLSEAESLPGSVSDWELHEQLGFLDQLEGERSAAVREYEEALAADKYDSVAAGNLALLRAQDHQYGAAIDLWSSAFEEDPVQLKAGMNLAIVECGVGRKESALETLERILAFSPDDREAWELEEQVRSGRHACGAR